jgi:hypothetical protein
MRRTNQRGSVPIEFVLGIGLLILPVTLLVLQVPRWLERAHLAEDLALESARICAQSDTLGAGEAAARTLAAESPHVVAVSCADPRGNVEPGSPVQASVTVDVPAIEVPIIGINTGSFTLTRRHTERVDQYRSFGP